MCKSAKPGVSSIEEQEQQGQVSEPQNEYTALSPERNVNHRRPEQSNFISEIHPTAPTTSVAPPQIQFLGGYDDSDSDSGVLAIEERILEDVQNSEILDPVNNFPVHNEEFLTVIYENSSIDSEQKPVNNSEHKSENNCEHKHVNLSLIHI